MPVRPGSSGNGTTDPTPRNGGVAKHPAKQGDNNGGGNGTRDNSEELHGKDKFQGLRPSTLRPDVDKSGTMSRDASAPATRERGNHETREQKR